MSTYVSPRSLTTKSVEELRQLREKMRRLLYFGLEPGLRHSGRGTDPLAEPIQPPGPGGPGSGIRRLVALCSARLHNGSILCWPVPFP